MNKGFIFSLEATLALIIFGTALLFLFQPTEISLKEVIILQQSNDLLKVWSIDYPTASEAINDCEQMFGNGFDLEIGGLKIKESDLSGDSITTNAILLDDFLVEKEYTIRVYTG